MVMTFVCALSFIDAIEQASEENEFSFVEGENTTAQYRLRRART